MSNALTMENQVSQAQDLSTPAIMFDFSMIERMNELAKMMSTSKVAVPQHFRGSPGDCLAVVMQAAQWGMNPFAVAQKTFSITGTLGYEAQLVNAVIAARAPVTGRIEYEWYGPWERVLGKFIERESKTKKDDHGHPIKYRTPNWSAQDEEGCGVRVWATFKSEKEPRVLELLLTQARTRNSTLWADDPRQQLAYLAVKRWARLYCPDVILGVYTPDELEERSQVEKDITPTQPPAAETAKPSSRAEAARQKLASRKPAEATPVVDVPSVDEVMAAIVRADTLEALNAVASDAGKLAGEEKDLARQAWKQQHEFLLSQQAAPAQDDFLADLEAAEGT